MCREFGIRNYTINKDGIVDVNGDVFLNMWKHGHISKFPPLKFGTVTGNFICNRMGLSTLEGCPRSIGGNLFCYINRITSFVGGPTHVGGDIYCNDNRISSLKGLPETFGGQLYCQHNPLEEIYTLNPINHFAELLVEYDVIRDENKVVETRLRQALQDSGCQNIPEEFDFENYEVV